MLSAFATGQPRGCSSTTTSSSRALLSTAVPRDPGKHVITARAEGFKPWSKTVTLDREGATVTVDVPLLEGVPPVAPTTPSPAVPDPQPPVPAPADPKPLPQPETEPVATGLLIAGAALGGVGVVLLAVAGGFTADAASAWDQASCTDRLCTSFAAQASSEQARDSATTATQLGIAGAVGLAAGVVLLIVGASWGSDVEIGESGLAIRF